LALTEAEAAVAEGQGRFQILGAVTALVMAQASAGRRAEAEQSLVRLEELFDTVPSGPFVERGMARSRGFVALEAGDAAAAIDQFTRAESLLTPRGWVAGAEHLDLWFDLASAHLAAGQDAPAATWLERITGSAHERLYDPIAYVRSHYLLAQVRERQGDTTRANELYSRFLDFWGNGDMDRAWVDDARRKVGG
jgi:tetratricopeptide (TPR) repeat protein